MKAIQYLKGDATAPTLPGNKIIAHICNDAGRWGKGIVLTISKRWKEPEASFRSWFASGENFELGKVQFVQVSTDTWVANIIGQHNVASKKNMNMVPPVRYEAIAAGLRAVGDFALAHNATVHMPRIGCGLAGGTWDRVEPLIQESLSDNDVAAYVYDFE